MAKAADLAHGINLTAAFFKPTYQCHVCPKFNGLLLWQFGFFLRGFAHHTLTVKLETHNLLPMHFVNTSENRQADEKSSIPKRHSENKKYYVAGRPANDK